MTMNIIPLTCPSILTNVLGILKIIWTVSNNVKGIVTVLTKNSDTVFSKLHAEFDEHSGLK